MLAFHCPGIDYLFAYCYDDFIQFVQFPHLSSVMGCLALGSVLLFFFLRLRPACSSGIDIDASLPYYSYILVIRVTGVGIYSNGNFNFLLMSRILLFLCLMAHCPRLRTFISLHLEGAHSLCKG